MGGFTLSSSRFCFASAEVLGEVEDPPLSNVDR